ncbi:MAG: lactate utilization protein [Deltaproteobacteria bacterium]
MDEDKKLIEAKRWHAEKRIQETIHAINRNNMEGIYAKDREEALNEILARIPPNATVSHGGSYTLQELGITEILRKGEYRYLRQQIDPNEEEEHDIRIKSFSSDVYLTSVNAITRAGELIAIDGFGNRVACLLFGPQKVLVVAGRNKIVDTLEDGIKRIKEYAAPIHAKRRGWDLPCTKTGTCVDCRDPRRICNKLAILQYERNRGRTTVILVGEDLGI